MILIFWDLPILLHDWNATINIVRYKIFDIVALNGASKKSSIMLRIDHYSFPYKYFNQMSQCHTRRKDMWINYNIRNNSRLSV